AAQAPAWPAPWRRRIGLRLRVLSILPIPILPVPLGDGPSLRVERAADLGRAQEREPPRRATTVGTGDRATVGPHDLLHKAVAVDLGERLGEKPFHRIDIETIAVDVASTVLGPMHQAIGS